MLDIIRTTLGDYNCIVMSIYLNTEESCLFWIMWFVIVVVGSIIFLNFIIAEASASYEKVFNNLDEFIEKQKADLISESENLTPAAFKNHHSYPKFIVMREVDQ